MKQQKNQKISVFQQKRQERLMQALRANLRKRKEQERCRKEEAGFHSDMEKLPEGQDLSNVGEPASPENESPPESP